MFNIVKFIYQRELNIDDSNLEKHKILLFGKS